MRLLLSIVFFFSGFSSLIYQVVWQRLLTLYYGVGAVSTALIVSVYMLGLGLGALCGGFLAERVRSRLKLYFMIELFIAGFGFLSLGFLDWLGRETAGSSYLLSFVFMIIFLSFPTFLMGMTLPVLTKIFNRQIRNFFNTVSFLYFINTLGASLGAVFASYGLISLCGLDGAVYGAVVINIVLCVLIAFSSFIKTDVPDLPGEEKPVEYQQRLWGRGCYVFVFLTGFLAIGYEIIWFRLIGILVKGSPYAFSSILSVYLLGIALGSLGMQRVLRKKPKLDRTNLFFSLQFLIGFFTAVILMGYFYLTQHTLFGRLTEISFNMILHPPLPFFFVKQQISSPGEFWGFLFYLTDVFLWPFFFVFIPTLFMGASLPVISSLALSRSDREGRTVGDVYFFNILGNVAGGLCAGFLLLPFWGTERTALAFVLFGMFFGFLVRFQHKKKIFLSVQNAIIFSLCFLVLFFFPRAGAIYRVMHTSPGPGYKTFLQEGREGVVLTYQKGKDMRNYINGMSHGGRPIYSFYFETIEALSYTPEIKDVLIIGFGTGSMTETALLSREVRNITQVEINTTLLKNLQKIELFRSMLGHPKVDLVVDDARRYLLRTDKTFDVILLDPLRTTTAYSNNLYSRQFFEIAQKHLKKRGIILVWMDEYRVMLKTVSSVFKYIRAYGTQREGFCLAGDSPFRQNVPRWKRILRGFSAEQRKEIADARPKYLGNEDFVKKITQGYPVNEDWRPVDEYYLGLIWAEWSLQKRLFFYLKPG